MMTYQQAMDSIDQNESRSLLLANGFSQAWNTDIFNYANLLDAAHFGQRDAIMKSLFNNLKTYDFEVIMRQLDAAEVVCKAYNVEEETVRHIKEDKEALKKALIKAISKTHPEVPGDVKNNQYILVRTFLSPFRQIFTVNYDLLFYWARNQTDIAPTNFSTDDGFRKQNTWKLYGTNQNVYFLHGALHIYESELDIKKQVYTNIGNTIIEQVRENLDEGKFPLFVSEPTHDGKRKKIEHNPYLNYCFQALRKITGTLFIYGHSMDENDKHIFDQIKESNIKKCFVSIYGDEQSEDNKKTKSNARTFLEKQGLDVAFFNAETTPVWKECAQ